MRHALSIALLSLALASPALAANSVDALLRQRGEAFVAALNAPGEDALDAFARNHLESRVSREGLTPRFVERMRETTAELGLVERHTVQVLPGGRNVFVYCKHAKSGVWQNYQFRVHADDDHRIQLVFRAVAIEPMARPTSPIDSPESEAWLRKFQDALEEAHPFSGVIVVRKKGKDVYSLVKGMANDATAAKVTRTTRMNTASGSKMFTAVAILQLAQAGKLSLSEPLIKYLPSFPDQAFAKRATIHQLLTHTAGAGDYWDDDYEKAWGSITALPQMLPFALAHLGDTPPGEFSYSNSGFILLGLVVEAVSGTNYYDYVEKNILTPAGMKLTGFPTRSEAGPDTALAYESEMDSGLVKQGVYVPVALGARGSSAGGASTTADDMIRFADALKAGTLLDQKHTELLTGTHVVYSGPDSWYGYGTILDKKSGVFAWGHGGSARGTQFEFRVFPELDTVMVVMSNYNTIAANEMASALDQLIRNR